MKKAEILKKLQEIYEKVDELETDNRNTKELIGDVRSLLEDIPDEESEFCDDEKELESDGH